MGDAANVCGVAAKERGISSLRAAAEALAASDTSAPPRSPSGRSLSPPQWQSPPQAAAAPAALAAPAAAAAAATAATGAAALSLEPQLLVIAGPSGVGKGTLVRRLRQHWPQVSSSKLHFAAVSRSLEVYYCLY